MYILLEDGGPVKRHKLENWVLFDLLSMSIVNVIGNWLIGIEHYETFKHTVENIKFPRTPVMCMQKHKHWVLYLYFGNGLIYQETKFHWADRYYIISPCVFGPDTHLLENNNELIY